MVGAGILLSYLIELILRLFGLLIGQLLAWNQSRNVMNRLPELSLQAEAALLWIAHHPGERVQGSPLENPLRELRLKGFLKTTQDDLYVQAFLVHPKVYSRKRLIGARFTEPVYTAILQGDAPWPRRRA
jgi:hypothetical protein